MTLQNRETDSVWNGRRTPGRNACSGLCSSAFCAEKLK